MKRRNRPVVNTPRLTRRNPTRTTTAVRAHISALRRQFADLRRRVIAAFREGGQFSVNSFCPTGPGGGVDPSCSPGSSSHLTDDQQIDKEVGDAETAYPAADISDRSEHYYYDKGQKPSYEGDVGGLTVRTDVPNEDSIEATYDSREYTQLDGIRAVPVAALEHLSRYTSADDNEKVDKLVRMVGKSEEISPLILVSDHRTRRGEGLSVLEGNHRARALIKMGVTHVPAVVIVVHTEPTANTFNPDQPRNPDGTFAGGGFHVVRAEDLLHTPVHVGIKDAIAGFKARAGGKLTEYVDRVPGGKYLREKLGRLNAKLKERYGDKTMGRIVAAANVLSWSVTIGTAALGAPIPIPSSGLMLAGVVLAESHLQLRRGLRAVGITNAAVDIEAEARTLLLALIDAHREFTKWDIAGASPVHFPQGNGRGHVANWAASTSAARLNEFQGWLRQQVGSTITGQSQEQFWQAYIVRGWQQGAGRAFDDTNRSRPRTSLEEDIAYQGGRQQFLRDAFNHPVNRNRVDLLASRTFDEMEDVGRDVVNRLSRTLVDGMIEGASTDEIARNLVEATGFGLRRAENVARTEIVRAHAEGQLDGFEMMGVDELGVMAEVVSTPDGKTCAECAALEGQTFTIEEARGMIPVHPSCRCAWIPNVDDAVENRRLAVNWCNQYGGTTCRSTPRGSSGRRAGQLAKPAPDTEQVVTAVPVREATAEAAAIPVLFTKSAVKSRMNASIKEGRGGAAGIMEMMAEHGYDAGDVKEHGMTTPARMRKMDVDGVSFEWEAGTEKQMALTIANLVAKPIPDKLWAANGRVMMTTQQSKDDPHWQKAYNNPDHKSIATGGDGNMVIYNGKAISPSIVAHESGHNLAMKTWGDTKPPYGSDYGRCGYEPPVSRYGANSRDEDFAEACRMYATDRENLRENFPSKHDAIHAMLR